MDGKGRSSSRRPLSCLCPCATSWGVRNPEGGGWYLRTGGAENRRLSMACNPPRVCKNKIEFLFAKFYSVAYIASIDITIVRNHLYLQPIPSASYDLRCHVSGFGSLRRLFCLPFYSWPLPFHLSAFTLSVSIYRTF